MGISEYRSVTGPLRIGTYITGWSIRPLVVSILGGTGIGCGNSQDHPGFSRARSFGQNMENPKPNVPPPAIRLYRFKAYPLWQAQKGLCFYCAKPMLVEANWEDPMLASRDHFIPKCLGSPLRHNFVFACRRCNTKHGDALPTVKELERFIELYQAAKMNSQWVKFRLGELGVQVLQTAMERALVT